MSPSLPMGVNSLIIRHKKKEVLLLSWMAIAIMAIAIIQHHMSPHVPQAQRRSTA